jgi:hypothetical protein
MMQKSGKWAAFWLVLMPMFIAACSDKPAEDASASKAKSCELMKDLFRACYDQSSPSVSCAQLSLGVREEFFKKINDSALVESLARLCDTACDARKAGSPWSDMNARLDCSQITQG